MYEDKTLFVSHMYICFFSDLCNICQIVVICSKTSPDIQRFKYCLLLVAISELLLSLNLGIFLMPDILFPVPACAVLGIAGLSLGLSKFAIFLAIAQGYAVLNAILVCCVVRCLLICGKANIVAKVITWKGLVIFIIIHAIYVIWIGLATSPAMAPLEEFLEQMKQRGTFPGLNHYTSLNNTIIVGFRAWDFSIVRLSMRYFYLPAILIVVLGSATCFTIMTVTLHKAKDRLSDATKKAHKTYMLILLLQFIYPLLFIALPSAFVIVGFMFDISWLINSVIFSRWAVTCIVIYPGVSTVITISLIKAYRVCELGVSVNLDVFLMPDILFPLPGACILGIFSVSFALAKFGVLLVISQVYCLFSAILASCFIRLLLLYGRADLVKKLISLKGLLILAAYNIIHTVAIFFITPMVITTEEEFVQRYRRTSKAIQHYAAANNTIVIGFRIWDMPSINYVVYIFYFPSIFVFIAFTIGCFLAMVYKLSLAKQKLSLAARRFHGKYICILLLQILYPVVFIVTPCGIVVTGFIYDIKWFYTSEFLTKCVVTSMIIYLVISTLITLTLIKSYRQFVAQLFRVIFTLLLFKDPLKNRSRVTECDWIPLEAHGEDDIRLNLASQGSQTSQRRQRY